MQLSLANPQWLWALPFVVGLAFITWRHHRRHNAVFSVRQLILSYGSLALCILGIARPQLGETTSSRKSKGANVFVAVDISRSMLAEDVAPSRLRFAKSAIQLLGPQLSGSRLSLFPFAADGYVQVPLTHDFESIQSMLISLSPNMTTDQGTDLSQSFETLFLHIQKMKKESLGRGEDWPGTQVLLFSDGESHHKLQNNIFAKYRSENIPIFSIGTGTPQGARIPLSARDRLTSFNQERHLKDSRGNFVETKLDAKKLRSLSEYSGGQYFPARLDQMRVLGNQLLQKQRTTSVSTQVRVTAEYFPLILALAFLMYFVELCMGRWQYALRSLAPLFFLLTPIAQGSAVDIQSLQNQLENSQYAEDKSILTFNLALAYLEKNDLEKAATHFQESQYLSEDPTFRKKALFNLGNTLLQLQKPQEAIQAYQTAYDLNTENETFEEETNKKLSENISIAAKILRQAQSQSQSGEGDPKSGQTQDPKKSKKDYQAEKFSKARKRRIFDHLASEEQKTIQRLQRKRSKNKNPISQQAKTW